MITGPPNVTTHHTTRVSYCEICNEYGNFYNNLDYNILHLMCSVHNNFGNLCDKHKREYDVKLNIKLRKDKLNRINDSIQTEI
jgi:hypothetical protein